MNPRMIWIVFRKEMLDIIRDRRTLIFMILLPLLLIPLLMNLISSFTISSAKNIAAQDSIVAVVGAEYAPGLVGFLREDQLEKDTTTDDPLVVESLSQVNSFLRIRTDVESVSRGAELIREKEIQAVVKIPEGFQQDLAAKRPTSIQIHFLSTNDRSEKAYERLRRSLNYYHDEYLVKQRLEEKGETFALIQPFETSPQDLAEPQERAGEVFGRILPYLVILMTFGGAVFPAISLAAGEKEQKTLETLLASPARRTELVSGKFMVIAATGFISAVLSLVGLYYGMTFGEMGDRMREVFSLQMDTTSIVMAVLLVIPLAVVFAGLLLTISVFARSYREAQSYIAPLNIAIILPAFASFLPGVELNYTLSLVPVVNVSLVLKEILSGKALEVLHFYGLTFISTLVIAALAIWLCAKMFSNEKAIFKI